MSEDLKFEVISRRRMLSLSGLMGVWALAVPPILLTIADAEAQVDKPLPGEGGTARTSPQQLEKHIPGDETRVRRRRYHRGWLRERHDYHRKRRSERSRS